MPTSTCRRFTSNACFRVDREPDDRIRAWLLRAWRRVRGRPLGDSFLDGDATAELRLGLADADELIRQPGNAERALAHFAHVAGVWRSLAPSRIGRLLVALQPVPDWFARSLAPHESVSRALGAHRTSRTPRSDPSRRSWRLGSKEPPVEATR